MPYQQSHDRFCIRSIRNLRKTCAKSDEGVHGVNLDVPRGAFLALLGTSGSGETTLLQTIRRPLEPTECPVRFAGVEVSRQNPEQLRRQIGYALQAIGLFLHMIVEENVAVGPSLLGRNAHEIEVRTRKHLDRVGLPAVEDLRRRPAELSGGKPG